MTREFSIWLYENLAVADRAIIDLTDRFPIWRHSTRSTGGNWHGEGEYVAPTQDMELFFLENLGRRIRVMSGGLAWWEGQIVRMEFTRKGQTFIRSMEEMANRVKVIYQKVGPNLFTNGDVESGAWTQVGTPSTHETTTDWWSKGTTSMHVVTDAAAEGTEIETGISISQKIAYSVSCILNIVSGTWDMTIRDDSENTQVRRTVTETGRQVLQLQIPEANNEMSTCSVEITAQGSGAEMYADGAMFRTSPVRSETKWYEDTDSITDYGRIEAIILEREMTDNEADGAAQKELAERAWMRTQPPRRGTTFLPSEAPPDRLIVTCMGMVWTLTWRHALTSGTDQADNHVNALLDESEFVASADAIVATNTAEIYLETQNPTTLWDELEKCIANGDGAGTAWIGGCYPDREFHFEARPTGVEYTYREGQMRYYGGGLVVPVEFQPGWCWMADMPVEPVPAGADAALDDPRRVWLDETWFYWDGGQVDLGWTQEEDAD
jgi:hypothetical protein